MQLLHDSRVCVIIAVVNRLPRALKYLWASPYSALGLLAGAAAVVAGAHGRVHAGTLEFAGGALGTLLGRLPPPLAFSAVTLGHVILAVDAPALAALRRHEQVHVRQYERWGPFFLPAYFASSLFQLARGRNPYRENHFEREAYGHDH
jgi:hypothetical protein